MSQCSVSDALANSMKIRAHFKHSQLAQSLLEDLQHEMQGAGTTTTPARLVQDVQREATSLCRCCRPQLAGNTVSQRVGFAGKKSSDGTGALRGVNQDNQLSDHRWSRRNPSRHKTALSRTGQTTMLAFLSLLLLWWSSWALLQPVWEAKDCLARHPISWMKRGIVWQQREQKCSYSSKRTCQCLSEIC